MNCGMFSKLAIKFWIKLREQTLLRSQLSQVIRTPIHNMAARQSLILLMLFTVLVHQILSDHKQMSTASSGRWRLILMSNYFSSLWCKEEPSSTLRLIDHLLPKIWDLDLLLKCLGQWTPNSWIIQGINLSNKIMNKMRRRKSLYPLIIRLRLSRTRLRIVNQQKFRKMEGEVLPHDQVIELYQTRARSKMTPLESFPKSICLM
jgi:hypothetical protein